MSTRTPKQIAKELYDITERIRVKFETNQKDRHRIQEMVKNKEMPDGYRIEWIKNVALDILDLIKKEAKLFNSKHPNDIATVEDINDIIQTVSRKLNPK